MLVRLCSKSFMLSFSSMWTKNFQMHKWVYKRQRKQRSNCQHSLDHRKAKEFQKNITSASWIRRKPLTVWTSLVAQTVKHLPTRQETWVWSLGWEDPLEKETTTHSSTLAWKIPRTEDPGRLLSMGLQRVGHDFTFTFTLTVWITTNCGKFLKRWEYQTTLPVSWETCIQVKKQQLESSVEQTTGLKLGKSYKEAVCCHQDCLTFAQTTSCKKPGWMNHKLEWRLPGEISTTSNVQMIPS